MTRDEKAVHVLVSGTAVVPRLGPLPDGVVVMDQPDPEVELVVIDPAMMPRLADLLPQMPALRVAQSTFAGVDALLPLFPPSVTVCAANGAHDIAVSEWVVAAILTMRRHFPEFLQLQSRGEWKSQVAVPEAQILPDLDKAEVLIIGFGHIGRAVAARLAPFGCRISGVASHRRDGLYGTEDLDALLPQADVVVLLAPLTEQTKGLVDAAFLARMKDGATLVNAARGGLVDSAALLAALRDRRIRAALDVTDPEPLPADDPLWSAPGLLITPHLAGTTRAWLDRAYELVGAQIARYVKGAPLLNRHAGSRA